MKVLHLQVVVEVTQAENKTASGIITLKPVDEVIKRGTVLAVGNGQYEGGVFIKPEIQVGDVAVYTKYSNGLPFEFEGKKALVLNYREVVGYERQQELVGKVAINEGT